MEKTSEILEELRACMTPRMEGIEKGEFEVFDMAELTSLGEKYNNHKVGVSKTETPTPTDKDYLVVGNGAKMREALEDAEKTLSDSSRSLYGIPPHMHRLLARIRDALATPPRNCDVPTVITDPLKAWSEDNDAWDEFGNPKKAIYEWLFAEAEG